MSAMLKTVFIVYFKLLILSNFINKDKYEKFVHL